MYLTMMKAVQALEERIDASTVWAEIECLWSLIDAIEDYASDLPAI